MSKYYTTFLAMQQSSVGCNRKQLLAQEREPRSNLAKNKRGKSLMQKTRVLMVGCGKMGGALLFRWLDQTQYTFTVVSPSGREMPEGVATARAPEELQQAQFDLIVIAVKPQMIPEIMPAYNNFLAIDGCFLSIAAGFSTASILALVGEKPLVRVMPNMPVQIGKGVSAMYANQYATQQQRLTVETLMQSTGQQIWVEAEDDIDRLTAIVGSGPGYVFEIARCWMKAAQTLGFAEAEAKDMVLRTLAGSVELALESPASLSELRNNVTSKNGTTAAGLSALNPDAILDGLLKKTVEAAYARAVELR
ncbi:MAG: pyrroline-5-carboxylate reductase [Candidatus Azotimanducaceae bacterium]|jgi:pyrroline-5-carboxylate reductase